MICDLLNTKNSVVYCKHVRWLLLGAAASLSSYERAARIQDVARVRTNYLSYLHAAIQLYSIDTTEAKTVDYLGIHNRDWIGVHYTALTQHTDMQ